MAQAARQTLLKGIGELGQLATSTGHPHPLARLLPAGAWARRAAPFIVAVSALPALAWAVGLYQVMSRWTASGARADAPGEFLWLIAPAACSCGVAACAAGTSRWRVPAGLIAALVWIALAVVLGPAGLLPSLVVPALVIAFEAFARMKGHPSTPGLLPAALLMLVVSVAALMRFMVLPAMLRTELDGDAIAYLAIAQKSHLFNTEAREPFFIWLLKLMRLFTGDYSAAALRTSSVLLSLVVTAGVFVFARRHLGLVAACVAGFLYAYSPAFVFTATRGLREEIIIAFFLLFAHLCITQWGRLPTLRGMVALGVAYMLCNYIRLSSNVFCALASVGVFAWGAWRHRLAPRRWWLVAVPILIGVLPLTPYLAYCQEKYGDPFFSMSLYPRFYANLEFAGTPGFPTVEEVEADAFAGGPISVREYVFGHHTMDQVAGRTAFGMWRLYFSHALNDYPVVSVPAWSRPLLEWVLHFGAFNLQEQPLRMIRVARDPPTLLLWLQTLGLIALCLPGRRVFFLLVFLFHAPVLFLASIDEFDWRLLTVALTAFQIGTGAAAQTVVDGTLHLWRRQREVNAPARPQERAKPGGRRTKKPANPDYRR